MIQDCVGSSFWEQNAKSLAVDGRWILYGLLGGGSVTGDLLNYVLKKRASLIGTTLRSRSLAVSYYLVFSKTSRFLHASKFSVLFTFSFYLFERKGACTYQQVFSLQGGKLPFARVPHPTGLI